MSLVDRVARRPVAPSGPTWSAVVLNAALLVLGALAFRPTIDGLEGVVLVAGLVGVVLLVPPALVLDGKRLAADTDWRPRLWLYLPMALVPNPVGFLALGDYLRRRRVALRDGGSGLEDPVHTQILRLFGPALLALLAISMLADATAYTAAPASVRYGVVLAVEGAFYAGYVLRG